MLKTIQGVPRYMDILIVAVNEKKARKNCQKST